MREVAAADGLTERHRQARTRVVDRCAEFARIDQVSHLREPGAHTILVDRREPQLAEPRQQPLAALRRVVLQRAGGDVRALGFEHARPELAEGLARGTHLAAPHGLDGGTACGHRGAAAFEPTAVVSEPSDWRKTNRQRVLAAVS